jgi:hypothetical protein
MTTKQRTLAVLAAVVIILTVFGVGYASGNISATHPPALTGDGYVGADQASFQVGETWYGFRSSVAWTDEAGSWHDTGWPVCLPKLQAVTGVRFVGTTIWAGNVGQTQVIWVDCQGR